MASNIGSIDRILRTVVGGVLPSMPLYALFEFSTRPLQKIADRTYS